MTAPSVPRTSKTCSVCQETKIREAFPRWGRLCQVCKTAIARTKRHEDPAKHRASSSKSLKKHPVSPEKNRAKYLKWRLAHPEKARVRNRKQQRRDNPEKNSARNLKWRHDNPEKSRANHHRKRARKAHAIINDFTAEQWLEMLATYGYRCVYCGRTMPHLTQDHIIPLSGGGNHTQSNIVPACMPCNRKKYTGPPLVPVQPMLL
jgi:5-methylcytosine-specific restriction endonuclease McrA